MGSIDAIIPVGGLSWCNDWELKYSLRSIEKHFLPIRDVYVIGRVPGWYTGKAIPWPDGRLKQFNIASKVLRGCLVREVSETFLYTNDDFFFTEDCTTIPDYYSGTVEEWARKSLNAFYRSVCKNSAPGRYYDVHTPMLATKTNWVEMMKEPWGEDHLVKSGYLNQYGTNPMELNDPKIRKEQPIPTPFLSTPNDVPVWLVEKIHDLYPNKSRWESS